MWVCLKVENNVTSEHKRYLGHMFSGVHFNDSHNTQPSENYLNLLIARIFAIEFSLQFATIHPTLNILFFFGKKRGIQQNSVLLYVYHNFLSISWRLAKYAYCHVIARTNKQCCTTTHEIDTVGKKYEREKKSQEKSTIKTACQNVW